MSILKKIFGANEKDSSNDGKENTFQTEFSEGDIFYTYFDNNFHISKLLKFDREFDTYHVLSYQPAKQLPETSETANLNIFAYHAPIDKNGFKNPKLFAKSKVFAADLIGYHEYLRQTTNSREVISIAQSYYLEGNRLAEEKRFEESIDEYSKAVNLFPQFYEAVENRGFSQMDLGRWNQAIKDFEMSLEVFPESLSALFSIGECYLKMGEIANAENYFEKTLAVDPNHRHSKDFLRYTAELRKLGLQDTESPDKVAVLLQKIKQA